MNARAPDPGIRRIAVGRYVLLIGDPAGAEIVPGGGSEPRKLKQAIDRVDRERQPRPKAAAQLEHATQDASTATDKAEGIGNLADDALRGTVDLASIGGEITAALGLLQRYVHDERWQEALRIARSLAVVLALLERWVELLESLRVALDAAVQSADVGGKAWALHELGTLRLAAGDHVVADRQLSEAHDLRSRLGEEHATEVTDWNLRVLCRTLRARLHEPQGLVQRILRQPVPAVLAAMTLLVIGCAVGAVVSGNAATAHIRPLAVQIGLTPSSPRVGEPAAFSATVGHRAGLVRYAWRFGDGTDGAGANPTHAYRQPGVYTVKVTATVSGAHGALVGQATRRVLVQNELASQVQPPSATFTFQPARPVVGQAVSFDATGSTDPDPGATIAGYVWRLGDGQTATGPRPTHAYDRPGTYTAELIVADTREASASTTRKVVVQSTTPSAPTGVSASGESESATVRWSAPARDGGSPIGSYEITPYIGASAQPMTLVTGSPPATGATVTGLQNGTTYTFTVTAVNAAGPGPASAHSAAVTTLRKAQGGEPPSPPTGVGASAGDESATVTWKAPAEDGSGPLTGYAIVAYVGTGIQPAMIVAVSPAETSKLVTGLTNGGHYTFTITAVNAVGPGPVSERSPEVTPTSTTASGKGGTTSTATTTTTTTTPPPSPSPPPPVLRTPSAPEGVSTSASDKSATVKWTAPAENGGSPIVGYTITPYVGSSPQAVKVVNALPGETSKLVSGLADGTTYTFTVTARNAIGPSSPSEHSQPVTPATLPSAPTEAKASGDGTSGSLAVKWKAPAEDGGSPIVGYTITPYLGSEALAPTTVTGSPPATSGTITGLRDFTRYTITVIATNAIGSSNPSEHSAPAEPWDSEA